MTDNLFEQLEQLLQSGGSEAGFDFLARQFREQKNYPMLFEARLMKKRHELGLPLIQTEASNDLPAEKQRAYEQATIDAAREVGDLFLADGEIQRAWPYLRAIGDPGPVTEAIEKLEPAEGMDSIIEIAFYEQANPRKGFELLLANHSICRAITAFGQYPVREGREESAALLVRTLHSELMDSLRRTVARQEGQVPDTESLSELIAGRDWLFEGNSYYIDTSHVASVVQLSLDLTGPETLALVLELTDYGKRLAPMYQFRGEPPFENLYEDHAIYLRALLGQDVEKALAHFREKIAQAGPNELDSRPAEALVKLLVRVKRYSEALEISRRHLREFPAHELACPSTFQLCQLAGDFGQLRKMAREKGDLLSFTAAALQG